MLSRYQSCSVCARALPQSQSGQYKGVWAALAGATGKASEAVNGAANNGKPGSGGAEVRATKWMSAAAGAQDGRKAAYLPFSGEPAAD